MENSTRRRLLPGTAYDHLLPKPRWKTSTIKRKADLEDTLRFIPDVIRKYSHQVSDLAPVLKGPTVADTCRNIWSFLYRHIAYRADKKGREQIRTPARSWADRKHGIDCDCYSVFIGCLLHELRIPFLFRVTKNNQRIYFQHIYVVVPLASGEELVLDCVLNGFNREAGYFEKKEVFMDLELLSGLGDLDTLAGEDPLGALFRRSSSTSTRTGLFNRKEKDKPRILPKVVNKVNRINPAAAALRLGILTGMKTNLFKISERLRFSYLTERQAVSKRLNMTNYRKLVNLRKKLEETFYKAGGKPENLRQSILEGKGNQNREVPLSGFMGLNGLDGVDWAELAALEQDQVPLMGCGCAREFQDELQGLGAEAQSLGNLTHSAAIKVADPTLRSFASLLANIGPVKPSQPAPPNPTTADLRNAQVRHGILLAMQENHKGMAGKLRFGYLPSTDVRRRGWNTANHAKILVILRNLTTTFTRLGGSTTQLRNAILTGKGNADKAIPSAGLRGLDEALGELGEPITLTAAMAAASGVLATISALLKQVGNVKSAVATVKPPKENPPKVEAPTAVVKPPPKVNPSKPPSPPPTKPPPRPTSPTASPAPMVKPPAVPAVVDMTTQAFSPGGTVDMPRNRTEPVTEGSTSPTQEEAPSKKTGVVAWVKAHPWQSVGIGAGTAVAIYGVYRLASRPKTKAATPRRRNPQSLNGVPKKRKSTRRRQGGGSGKPPLAPIELM